MANADPPGARFAAFDASIQRSLFGRGDLTVSVAVAKDGRLLHAQAFGTANPFTGEVATTSSRFRIGSISKTLLADAVLQLVQQRRIGLDDPVGQRLAIRLGVTLGDPARPPSPSATS